MSVLEDYFRRRTAESSEHPLLSLIDTMAARCGVNRIVFEVARAEDVLGFGPAKLNLHFVDPSGKDVQCHEFEWDDELNSALIARRVRAISIENECLRFALRVRHALRVAEIQYGDGFFNAVLVDYFRRSAFASHPTIESVLQHVHSNAVEPGSRSYSECTELIDAAIRGRALELSEDLGYPIPEAEEILASAVGQYLDERFSVSSRRVLGFL